MRRRFRTRGKGRKPTWAYAHAMTLLAADNALTTTFVGGWLLPPGRVRWLCEDWKQASITHVTTHMWLDFHWISPSGGGGGHRGIPDVYFYAIKSNSSRATGGEGPIMNDMNPWSTPNFPSAITDWEDETDDDGTDSFLWCHRMKGMSPPNADVGTYTYTGDAKQGANQTDQMFSSGTEGVNNYMCRTFSMRAEWQPDVIIRAKRRLLKDDGIALFLAVRGDTGVSAHLECWSRTIAR